MTTAMKSARRHLADAYLNQGIDPDEALDSVEAFVSRQGPISEDVLISLMACEAYRYEDM